MIENEESATFVLIQHCAFIRQQNSKEVLLSLLCVTCDCDKERVKAWKSTIIHLHYYLRTSLKLFLLLTMAARSTPFAEKYGHPRGKGHEVLEEWLPLKKSGLTPASPSVVDWESLASVEAHSKLEHYQRIRFYGN